MIKNFFPNKSELKKQIRQRKVMQPLILDVRGNPLEDSYTVFTDYMLHNTVLLCWGIKNLERYNVTNIDLTSTFESIASENNYAWQ